MSTNSVPSVVASDRRRPGPQAQPQLSGPELAESIIYGHVLDSGDMDDDEYELPKDADDEFYYPSYYPRARMRPLE
eukprot:scaffold585836_cov38-Prasinocladus_malaysianus.AAC.1